MIFRSSGISPADARGCSSVVEHLLAKERVESSNLFIRFVCRPSNLKGDIFLMFCWSSPKSEPTHHTYISLEPVQSLSMTVPAGSESSKSTTQSDSAVVETSAVSGELTLKQKAGDAANRWMARNRSLVLRQTPVWAQSLAAIPDWAEHHRCAGRHLLPDR